MELREDGADDDAIWRTSNSYEKVILVGKAMADEQQFCIFRFVLNQNNYF